MNIHPHNSQRLEFDMLRSTRFHDDRGIKVLWEKSYLCTCRNKMSHAPDPSCPICHGKGIAYLEPKETTMIIQSQEKGVVNGDIGLYDSGTAIGSTPNDSRITFRDRVSVPEVLIGQSLLFDVTQRRIDKGMWLSYKVDEIDLVVADDGQVLEEGVGYTFDSTQNLFFPDQSLLGKNISINLESILRYIVIDLLKESRYQYTNKGTDIETFDSLSKKLLLKREDAWVNPIPFSGDNEDGDVTPETTTDPKRTGTSGGFFGGLM